jgi:hypothetical protein
MAHVASGSVALTEHAQPADAGPGGKLVQPALQAPSTHIPLVHAQLAFGGGAPMNAQSVLGFPSSTWPLQLSSLPLQISCEAGAGQPIHMPVAPSQVAGAEQVPYMFVTLQVSVAPLFFEEQLHPLPPTGTHHIGCPPASLTCASGPAASP